MTNISSNIGTAPRLDWVEIGLIDIDHNYQRPIKPSLVRKILGGFKWDRFGAISLAEKDDGRFNCTEGQHRLSAARLHPSIDRVPAVISPTTGTEGEAQAFVAINSDRLAVTSIERYWAGLTAGDDRAIAISQVLQAAHCDVVPEPGHHRPNLTTAVSAVDRCLQRYGHGATRRALLVIRAAWPKDSHALRGTLITAVARVLRANEQTEGVDPGLVSVLQRERFTQLTAHAEGFRKLSGGTAETALARTITELANKGKRVNVLYFGEQRK